MTTNYYHQIFEYNTAGPGGTNTAASNNTASTTASVALAPYADLATTNVTAPQLTVGDPAKVTIGWTVTNVGTGPGTVSSWVDAIIVSPDNDPTHGTVIKQFTHTGILAVNGTYQQSQTFLLPPGYTTHSHLFVRTDATDQVFENGNEANNYGEAPNIFDVAPIPYADLAVSNVSSAATAGSGQPMQVTWTVTNQSPNAIGTTNIQRWSDSVYLASDPAGNNSSPTWAASITSARSPSAAATRAPSPPTRCPTACTAPSTSSSTPAGPTSSSTRTTTRASAIRWRYR